MDIDRPTPSRSSTLSQPPRGILKNANSHSSSQSHAQGQGHASSGHGLAWDEANLSLNEVQKDSTMKITEPKTPYVRYNAETDQVMDLDKIPGFELGQTSLGSPPLSSSSSSTRDNSGSRRGSEGSEKMVRVERTNSFNSEKSASDGVSSDSMVLDGEAGATSVAATGESSDDEEPQDEETKEHRKQFAQKRGRHYSNEAEAMKRAQALMASEDDDDDTPANDGAANEEAIDSEEEEDSLPVPNGAGVERPPVPEIPARFGGGGTNGV
ncbi:phosphatase inhibitor 2 family protein [Sporobolomyces salmoneus]|uniref:phosphatase inhibitor 2 family protein n=1 Tax=Sporobolomyces salmoneus TaxID=183962 RepID=UPI0031744D60